MEPFAIDCQGLTKHYGRVVALEGLDLQVPQRSLFGFLGPNGAGKTTLMRVLLGLAAPTGGTATVLGHDVRREGLTVRSLVGYLPQQPHFHEELTARQVLRYAAGFFPRARDGDVEDEITDVLDLVGLTAKADSRAGDLSGGQRQRLGIAQAQIHRPPLLILDEPAAALDPLGRRDVLAVMRALKESATVFYSTHILDDVQQVSDEVAILEGGRRVVQSPLDELLSGRDDHTFRLTLAGGGQRVVEDLRRQPWVADVVAPPPVDGEEWSLTVTLADGRADGRDLLRQVLGHEEVEVLGFGRPRSELEEVFFDVVEAGAR